MIWDGMAGPGNDALEALLAANEELYRAFEAVDLERMDRLWVHEERAVCVHPGWPMLRGWSAVRASWVRIFASTPSIRFVLTDVAAHVAGDVGWVWLTENVLGPDDTRASAVLATNLFERTGADRDWRLVSHHASMSPDDSVVTVPRSDGSVN
jgi:hypothetical protein